MDELLPCTRTRKNVASSAALCFTKIWLSECIRDAVLPSSPSRPCHRMFGEALVSTTNGGLVSQSSTHTSAWTLRRYFETLSHYLLHELSSVILASVYIVPWANANTEIQTMADEINELELKRPESPLIILGDFNGAQFNHDHPRYNQHIDCFTREGDTGTFFLTHRGPCRVGFVWSVFSTQIPTWQRQCGTNRNSSEDMYSIASVLLNFNYICPAA